MYCAIYLRFLGKNSPDDVEVSKTLNNYDTLSFKGLAIISLVL